MKKSGIATSIGGNILCERIQKAMSLRPLNSNRTRAYPAKKAKDTVSRELAVAIIELLMMAGTAVEPKAEVAVVERMK
jgi:hypothetical protein